MLLTLSMTTVSYFLLLIVNVLQHKFSQSLFILLSIISIISIYSKISPCILVGETGLRMLEIFNGTTSFFNEELVYKKRVLGRSKN